MVGPIGLLLYKMRVIRPLHNSPLELAATNMEPSPRFDAVAGLWVSMEGLGFGVRVPKSLSHTMTGCIVCGATL
jgi:hypothetical protein